MFHQVRCHGVGTVRKTPGEVYHGAVRVGVLWGPGLVSVHHNDHGRIEHRVTGRHAGLHGQGVNERLYGGAHLPTALTDIVVLEVAVVRTTDIGLHITRSWLYGHEGRAEEGLVIADGIVRGHDGVPVPGFVPGKDTHLDGLGKALVYL